MSDVWEEPSKRERQLGERLSQTAEWRARQSIGTHAAELQTSVDALNRALKKRDYAKALQWMKVVGSDMRSLTATYRKFTGGAK